jgi:thymidylate kinase
MNKSEAAGSASPAQAARIGRTIALVGADGAGKSTVARFVVERLPFDASYLYMGVNLETSHVMLPTTRLVLAYKRWRGGRTDMTAGNLEAGRTAGGAFATLRRLVRMANWVAEEAYRASLARRIQRRPATVVFDRDFFCDYYASAVAPANGTRTIDVRLHGYVLEHWYPRPDLAIFLDAPPEVLVGRKAGDTAERVAKRRLEYLDLASVLPAFQIVDANRPVDDVVAEVVDRIVAFVDGDARFVLEAGDGADGNGPIVGEAGTVPAVAPVPPATVDRVEPVVPGHDVEGREAPESLVASHLTGAARLDDVQATGS